MRTLLTAVLTTLSLCVFGQFDPTTWDSLKTVTTENYQFSFPFRWRQMPASGPKGPEQMLEASGLALPATFNNSPVILTVFIVKQEGNDLDDCKNKCLAGYRDNPDREFPKKFEDGSEKTALMKGQEAYFLNTRFFRKSKGLNQSRFDQIVYSEKEKTGYIYTLSVQYADNDYSFETENDLAAFAKKLFSYYQLAD